MYNLDAAKKTKFKLKRDRQRTGRQSRAKVNSNKQTNKQSNTTDSIQLYLAHATRL